MNLCSRFRFLSALVALPWIVFGEPVGATRGEHVVPPVRLSPARPPPAASPGSNEEVPSLLPEINPPRAAPAMPPLPPGVPPLGLPSDGEAAPEFPGLPDLPATALPAAPEFDPAAMPAPERDQEKGTVVPSSPPTPGLQMPGFAKWHRSPREAREIAAHEHRCLLLVMTASQSIADAQGQPLRSASQALNEEVFATTEFNDFALQHLVLSFVDYSRSPSLNDAEIKREEALKQMKERLNVRGFPTVILFGPDGKEINRWGGYALDPKTGKGRAPHYLKDLKEAVLDHEAGLFATQRRREKLSEQGYRDWTSLQGSRVFAKLIEFDAQRAVLRDESGEERKVELRHLDIADREIIARKRLGKIPTWAP
ncbi:MAG: hypothetical protein ACR2OZ_11510 [Verrucomicrobiales bacterium]